MAERRKARARCSICGEGLAGRNGKPCRHCLKEPPWRQTVLRYIAAVMKLNEFRRSHVRRGLSVQMQKARGRIDAKRRRLFRTRMRELSLKQHELAKLWMAITDRSLAKHVSRMERLFRARGMLNSPVPPTAFLGPPGGCGSGTLHNVSRCDCCRACFGVGCGLCGRTGKHPKRRDAPSRRLARRETEKALAKARRERPGKDSKSRGRSGTGGGE